MVKTRFSFTDLPHRLQDVTVQIISREKCTAPGIVDSQPIGESSFCAGSLTSGIGSCFGDSGGPLACDRNGSLFVFCYFK